MIVYNVDRAVLRLSNSDDGWKRNLILLNVPVINLEDMNKGREAFNKAINLAKYFGRDELVIIGGKQVYESLVHKVDRIILTVIPGEHEGDVFVDIPIIDLLRCHVPLFPDLETALER